ncbi:hypothetical protein [Actinocrispum wychmicini]|uniref:hypothetical protein n=1 Tax=Actinocrispum wychmicini TaxID=1213861 RepID=UPI001A9FBF6D|nr:hypothetical protein [Actinocrispum wychmicini]
MLDVTSIGRNPHGPEFGDYGLVHVRYGKAKKGSPPKRRSVATVWTWAAEILEEWVTEFRPLLATAATTSGYAPSPTDAPQTPCTSSTRQRTTRHHNDEGPYTQRQPRGQCREPLRNNDTHQQRGLDGAL